jgi:mRNA-degrading endonuclease toxin of MazEF toxin-antitoxin module
VIYGDIHWCTLPDRGGHEQRGHRPVIIWQDFVRFRTWTVLVIPITSRMSSLQDPGNHLLRRTSGNGLAVDSVALIYQLGASDLKRIGPRLGRLDDPDLAAIQQMARDLQMLPS